MFWSTFLHISFQEILLFNPSLKRWMSWVWVQLADITKILLLLQTDNLWEKPSKNTKNITYLVLFTFLVFLFPSLLWSFSCIPSLHKHINEETPLPPLGALSHLKSHLSSPSFCLRQSSILLLESFISGFFHLFALIVLTRNRKHDQRE